MNQQRQIILRVLKNSTILLLSSFGTDPLVLRWPFSEIGHEAAGERKTDLCSPCAEEARR